MTRLCKVVDLTEYRFFLDTRTACKRVLRIRTSSFLIHTFTRVSQYTLKTTILKIIHRRRVNFSLLVLQWKR